MKITLDSTESLEDAIRVLGAMYGVQLVVSGDEPGSTKLVEKRASRPSATRGKARKRASAANRAQPDVAGTAAAGADRSNPKTVTGPDGSPSNAEVRSWARRNGLAVSGRGRVAGSVMAAYRSANSG